MLPLIEKYSPFKRASCCVRTDLPDSRSACDEAYRVLTINCLHYTGVNLPGLGFRVRYYCIFSRDCHYDSIYFPVPRADEVRRTHKHGLEDICWQDVMCFFVSEIFCRIMTRPMVTHGNDEPSSSSKRQNQLPPRCPSTGRVYSVCSTQRLVHAVRPHTARSRAGNSFVPEYSRGIPNNSLHVFVKPPHTLDALDWRMCCFISTSARVVLL